MKGKLIATLILGCSFVCSSQENKDWHLYLLEKYNTPVSIVSEGVIERFGNSSQFNGNKEALALETSQAKAVQFVRKVFRLDAANFEMFKGSVEHISDKNDNVVESYYSTKGSGLIIKIDSSAKLRHPSPQIYAELAVGFPQIELVANLPMAQRIIEGKEGDRRFFDVFVDSTSDAKLRAYIAPTGKVVEIKKLQANGLLAQDVKVVEWKKTGELEFPYRVEKRRFKIDGSLAQREMWENKEFRLESSKPESFNFVFEKGISIFDEESGTSFWSNDILKDGWKGATPVASE